MFQYEEGIIESMRMFVSTIEEFWPLKGLKGPSLNPEQKISDRLVCHCIRRCSWNGQPGIELVNVTEQGVPASTLGE